MKSAALVFLFIVAIVGARQLIHAQTATTPQPQAPASQPTVDLMDTRSPAEIRADFNKMPVPPRQINYAIRRGVDYLYSIQKKSGSWETVEKPQPWAYGNEPFPLLQNTYGAQYGGTTAMVAFALLSAGESPSEPRLARAIEWLRRTPMHGVYALSMRLNAFALIPGEAAKDQMRADEASLLRAVIARVEPKTNKPNPNWGLYSYLDKPNMAQADHSVSQYGVLGAWESALRGMDPGGGYWGLVEKAWQRDQNDDGGWGYKPGQTSTAAMTVAGLATLFIAEDELHTGSGIECHGNGTTAEINRGMAWLASHFTVTHNPPSTDGPYYYLFGLQRVGVASGYRYIGAHDWYEEGARFLISAQHPNGSWPPQELHEPVHTTSFAILFLARGGQPTLVNKLQYDGNWNERPRDAAHLSRYFGHTYEREFQWQIVDIARDPVEFHTAPVLYLSGKGEMNFTPLQKEHIRRYIEDGGLLLGNADCADSDFAKSFTAMLADIFPQYPVRPLPKDHLIFTAYNPVDHPVEILAQSNGVRELALLITKDDIGRALQHAHPAEAIGGFDLASNICLYAADPSTLRNKYDPYIVWRDPRIGPDQAGWQRMDVARIRYDGNWDPEPGGWRRIADLLHNQYDLDLRVRPVLLGDGTLPKLRFAHITGTSAVRFNAQQLDELRVFLARGGTLLVDAAGGSTDFANSIEPLLNSIVPNSHLKPIPLSDPILGVPRLQEMPDLDAPTEPTTQPAADPDAPPKTDNIPQADVPGQQPHPAPATAGSASATRPALEQAGAIGPDGQILPAYRRAARDRVGSHPGLRLQGVQAGNRWLIIYSAEDLSAGLVGQNVDGVIGYTPPVATEIVRRILANIAPQP